MRVLGIESSCDETAFALVDETGLVHEEIASQAPVHDLFGGVVPELASREHYRVLDGLLARLLKKTGMGLGEIDAVAVARGPGLLGPLLVGLSFAKGLCLATGARLIGVNHLHAHLFAPGLEREIPLPALGLLVSGGHTNLFLLRAEADVTPLSRTLDDAAGEAYDKVAKLLNLPYPGGVFIDRLAQGAEPDTTLFSRPYLDNSNLDFSFSGLKTAVAQELTRAPLPPMAYEPGVKDLETLTAAYSPAERERLGVLCASFQWAVAGSLKIKLSRALAKLAQAGEPLRSLVLAGGVAANSGVRAMVAEVAEEAGLSAVLPRVALCTDNGAMIAHLGRRLALAGYGHPLTLEAVPRGRKLPNDMEIIAG